MLQTELCLIFWCLSRALVCLASRWRDKFRLAELVMWYKCMWLESEKKSRKVWKAFEIRYYLRLPDSLPSLPGVLASMILHSLLAKNVSLLPCVDVFLSKINQYFYISKTFFKLPGCCVQGESRMLLGPVLRPEYCCTFLWFLWTDSMGLSLRFSYFVGSL